MFSNLHGSMTQLKERTGVAANINLQYRYASAVSDSWRPYCLLDAYCLHGSRRNELSSDWLGPVDLQSEQEHVLHQQFLRAATAVLQQSILAFHQRTKHEYSN